MATKVLPGLIANGTRHIKKPQVVQVHFDVNNNDKTSIVVVENGDCRSLPISKKVAEVLISRGMAYGT